MKIPVALHRSDEKSRWLRCRPDALFTGDQPVTPHVRRLHAPGHTAGHTMYYDERDGGSLFTGDGILLNAGTWEIELEPSVLPKLAALRFARILPNHYDLVFTGADEQLWQHLKRGKS